MRDSLGRSRTRSFGFRFLSGLTKADKCPSWPRASPRNSVSRTQAVRIIDMSDSNAWCHLHDCARTRPHRGDSKRVRFRADGRTTLQSFQSPVGSEALKQRIWRAQALDRCAPYSPLERRAAPWGSRGRGHKSDKAPGRGRRTLGSFRETKGDPTSGGVRLAHGQGDRFIIEAVGVKRLWRASIAYS